MRSVFGSVRLPGALYRQMVTEAFQHFPLETGGVLLGRASGQHVEVINAVGAGPAADHSPHSFVPDRDWQYDRIDEIFYAEGGRISYLGDWHSHPGGAPVPSRTDRALLADTAANPACQCPEPIMVIVGKRYDQPWLPVSYRYVPNSRLPGSRVRYSQLLISA